MTKKNYLESLSTQNGDSAAVIELEAKYNCKFAEIVRKIITSAGETIFFDDDWRVLSTDEMRDAEHDLHVDFVKLGFLPLFDCGENDFIVYHTQDETYSMFNIVDECVFSEHKHLEEIIK